MGSSSNSRDSSSSHGDVLKPLVKGCLTGHLHAWLAHYHRSALKDLARSDDPFLKKKKLHPTLLSIPTKVLLKMDLVRVSISSTASLGIYEILSKRLRDGNEGMPLTVYQEGCCGFIAGSVATIAWHPIEIARTRLTIHTFSCTNWFTSFIHVAQNQTIWKCPTIPRRIAGYTGMLASYDPTLNYLTHTQSLPFWAAQISASITSGFFAAACSHPITYMQAIKNTRDTTNMRHVPRIISEILNPYSNFNFYTDFLKEFTNSARFCVIQYAIFEGVRRLEWIK